MNTRIIATSVIASAVSCALLAACASQPQMQYSRGGTWRQPAGQMYPGQTYPIVDPDPKIVNAMLRDPPGVNGR